MKDYPPNSSSAPSPHHCVAVPHGRRPLKDGRDHQGVAKRHPIVRTEDPHAHRQVRVHQRLRAQADDDVFEGMEACGGLGEGAVGAVVAGDHREAGAVLDAELLGGLEDGARVNPSGEDEAGPPVAVGRPGPCADVRDGGFKDGSEFVRLAPRAGR